MVRTLVIIIFQNPATDRCLCHNLSTCKSRIPCSTFRILPRIDASATCSWQRKNRNRSIAFRILPRIDASATKSHYKSTGSCLRLSESCHGSMPLPHYPSMTSTTMNLTFQNPATDRCLCHDTQFIAPLLMKMLSESCHGSMPLPLKPPPAVIVSPLAFRILPRIDASATLSWKTSRPSLPAFRILPRIDASATTCHAITRHGCTLRLSESCHGSMPLPLVSQDIVLCDYKRFQNPATDRCLCHDSKTKLVRNGGSGFQNPATDRCLCHQPAMIPIMMAKVRLSESCHGSMPLPRRERSATRKEKALSESCHGSMPLPLVGQVQIGTTNWLSESCHGSMPLPLSMG